MTRARQGGVLRPRDPGRHPLRRAQRDDLVSGTGDDQGRDPEPALLLDKLALPTQPPPTIAASQLSATAL
jgi:hypothetical protein